jgi:hypothetical protein
VEPIKSSVTNILNRVLAISFHCIPATSHRISSKTCGANFASGVAAESFRGFTILPKPRSDLPCWITIGMFPAVRDC